jgi:hypothetical protein
VKYYPQVKRLLRLAQCVTVIMAVAIAASFGQEKEAQKTNTPPQGNAQQKQPPDPKIDLKQLPAAAPGAISLGRVSDLAKSPDSFPNGRNLWSLLENHIPALIPDRFDTGGLATGQPALVGTLGASWTQTEYRLNGFNVTDPYATGLPLMNPSIDAIGGAQALEVESGAGAIIRIGTRHGAQGLHGAVRGFYSHDNLQSDNVDARLRKFNFAGPETLNHFVDGNAQLGGSIPFKNHDLPVFVDFSTQHLSKDLGGFPAPIEASVNRLLTRLSITKPGSGDFDFLYALQRAFNSHEAASPRTTPEATTRGRQTFQQFQTTWTGVPNAISLVEVRFGMAHAKLSSKIQDDADAVSAIDLPLLLRTGAAPFSVSGTRTRYEAGLMYSRTDGSHWLQVSGEFDRSPMTNRWDTPNALQERLINGTPAEVILLSTPTEARGHTQNLSLFAQSRWKVTSYLEVSASLHFEKLSGKASGSNNEIDWRTLHPRFRFAFSRTPFGNRETTVRGGWSRYGYALPGNYLDFGNPAALSEQVFRWADTNHDRDVQPQEVRQLLRRSGGAYSAIDDNLRRPYVDEISIGIEQELPYHLFARAKFFRRDDSRLPQLTNTGVPLSSYTAQPFTDPGNDGIAGTTDDQTLTLYNRKPAARGDDFLVLTNGRRASYKGFQIDLLRRLANRFEVSASFSAMRSLAETNVGNSVFENDIGVIGNLGIDPNTFLFANSRTFFDRAYTGKLLGQWMGPKDIRVAVVAKYYDGLAFGRLLFVEGFNQGAFFVRATNRAQPGGFRTQFNSSTDLRVAKEFKLSRGKLSVMGDVFNLLNQNQNLLEDALTSPTFEQRVPLAVQAPRAVRLGLVWSF